MSNKDFIYSIYNDPRTVFTVQDIALLLKETVYSKIKQKINYYVRKNYLVNIRSGIYAKESFDIEELACKIYTPAYISSEYVLQKHGIIFQYSENITGISYLSRTIEIDSRRFVYRKIKNAVLINTYLIERKKNGVNIAAPERALLDTLYLNKDYYFDNITGLDKGLVYKALPMYQSKQLIHRVNKLFENA